MPHHAGVDLILGTDCIIPAGIRLDMYNSTARLPDEVAIPLIKSRSAWLTEPTYGVSDGPAKSLSIPARMITEFTLRRKQPSEDTHEFWVRRTKDWIVVLQNAQISSDVGIRPNHNNRRVGPALVWSAQRVVPSRFGPSGTVGVSPRQTPANQVSPSGAQLS
ncbi:unnamed protein product [Phytophthora fragariaefolia]|uniref:Unnamed protein product n=1 Tax=Phytophthora fragariaefolia TaxID=1490495 RepID=A0A9W7D725_9STRA|nr:unnamed protein product [Phytophthora fragariaefolia]